MPWRLPRWAYLTLPEAVTLKRFMAPDLVFNLGIWLSCSGKRDVTPWVAPTGQLLARAMKKLIFLCAQKSAETPPRQPLISRAAKSGLIAKPGLIGNRQVPPV